MTFNGKAKKKYLNEKRDTVAGQGCDTNISFRAYVGNWDPLSFTDILDSSE